jgi:hypothetical protein
MAVSMTYLTEGVRRDAPPERPPGSTVPATRGVATGTPVLQVPGAQIAAPPRVRDLGHIDRDRKIFWKPELRAASWTLLRDREQMGGTGANAYMLTGGTASLAPPIPVPADQRVRGARVREAAHTVMVVARRPYTITGPIVWGYRWVPREDLIAPEEEGGEPTTEIVPVFEAGAPPAAPEGLWDLIVFYWFEPLGTWFAAVTPGYEPEQQDLSIEPKPEDETPTEKDEDQDNPEGGEDEPADYDDGVGPVDEEDIARPPGADDPDDLYTDPETGEQRRRSAGRLILLTRGADYFLSGNGGRDWFRFTGPFAAPVAGSVGGDVVHVVAAGEPLHRSDETAQAWTQNAAAVGLVETVGGNGGHLAVGTNGIIVLNGAEIVSGTSPLGDATLSTAAWRGAVGVDGSRAITASDERQGSAAPVYRDPSIDLVAPTFYGATLWVGVQGVNPTIAALTLGAEGFSQSRFGDTNPANWWQPDDFRLLFSPSLSWGGGSALALAEQIANAINSGAARFQARRLPFGPWLNAPATVFATAAWVDLGGGQKRAALTIRWTARAPGTGEFQRWFRPEHPQARLFENTSWAFGTSGASAAPFALTTLPSFWAGTLSNPETAPNSDSFAALQISAVDLDLSEVGGIVGRQPDGTVRGEMRVVSILDTRPGWTSSGPASPDGTISILEVEIRIPVSTGGALVFRGALGGAGLPVGDRPLMFERVQSERVVAASFVSADSVPVPPTVSSGTLEVRFPSGWRFPIDHQVIPQISPWLGMLSESSGSPAPVGITIRFPAEGGWLIAADDGRSMLSPGRSPLTFFPGAPLPGGAGSRLAAGGSYWFAYKGGQIWRSEDGLTWDAPVSLPDAGPWSFAFGLGRLVGVSSTTGAVVVSTDGGASFTTQTTPLAGRPGIDWVNAAAGRFWSGVGGTNLLFWSNDGEAWKALPAMRDTPQLEVEGF